MNQLVKHEFVIENTGRESLHVLRVVPGCGGCLKLRLSQEELVPGGKSVLMVILDTSKVDKGDFKKSLLLQTDDPRLPKVILYVQGTAM